ncbi:response regulator transcription factor [Geminicoccaceae bacterium 1502E]|nr:response regulator transcription factor [Geminicoccaceae bacterium 1502E]
MDTRSNPTGRSRILLLDGMPLRRACVANLLRGCGRAFDINALSSIAEEEQDGERRANGYALVLLNTGSITLRDPAAERLIEDVRSSHREAHLVVLSDRDDPRDVVAAFRCGARGYLPTSLEPEVAIGALKLVLAGGEFYPPTALAGASHEEAGAGRAPAAPGTDWHDDWQASELPPLTPRQSEVLDLLRQGKSNKHIARELDMRESTVKVHVRQIMRKLGVTNRTQAALLAVRPAIDAGRARLAAATESRELAGEAFGMA